MMKPLYIAEKDESPDYFIVKEFGIIDQHLSTAESITAYLASDNFTPVAKRGRMISTSEKWNLNEAVDKIETKLLNLIHLFQQMRENGIMVKHNSGRELVIIDAPAEANPDCWREW